MTWRILVTNDDGIHAEGIKRLEEAMTPLGEVTVVAPEREMSATSQSISLHSPLRATHFDDRHVAVAGTPADAVIFAIHHLLDERPDLVVSGINPGGNLGENVVYSGTVAAAMEATLHGVPAIAFSLASRKQIDYSAAAAFATNLAEKVLNEGLPAGVMLNVNVPRGEVSGVSITRMSRKITQNVIHEQKDPRGRSYFWHDETIDLDQVEPDSDYAAVLAHAISVTPLQVDRTDYASLNHLSSWLSALPAPAPK
jgi:5'/3'-nucleotidase